MEESSTADGSPIPTFYGVLPNEIELQKVERIGQLKSLPVDRIEDLFETHCRLPSCFASVFLATQAFTPSSFVECWKANFLGRTPNERLIGMLAEPLHDRFTPHRLTPYVNAIAQKHPSLQFLHSEPVFFGKYVEFVGIRLFFNLDPELRGTVGIHEMRRVDLAGTFFSIYHMEDVNEPTSLFNYQHFYVTFCKFWDLDLDGDGLLSKEDLLKFNDSALSPIICERFLHFPFAPRCFSPNRLVDFASFSYLLMCTQDKSNLTSINFWYRLCDLDDDGVISLHEISRLYALQYERMALTGNEQVPFSDVIRQLMDAVMPANADAVTVSDLLASKQADVFFNTLVDLQKFIMREYQAPQFDLETDELVRKLTPWEFYVLAEYDALVNDTG
jgi:serine/threonine-protein phosphatase 2A regulatory subunit B''